MQTPLPSNQTLVEFSSALPWQEIERQKRLFNSTLDELAGSPADTSLPLDELSAKLGIDVVTGFDASKTDEGNIVLAGAQGHQHVLGSLVGSRYRGGKSFLQSITRYNLNPSVNHTNIHETDEPYTRMRSLGAEIELGLVQPDGTPPRPEQKVTFIQAYHAHASKIGVYPRLDDEVCQYQVEAHIAPTIGYGKTRAALHGIFSSLAAASRKSGLRTAILSTYPTDSDFAMSPEHKVQTAIDLMLETNNHFEEYRQRRTMYQQQYHVPADQHTVKLFRIQGCHIHIDLAGRSEALGLLTFYTMLRSATAIANAAVLKGGPFMNGTCDEERLCVRDYLRQSTVTGRYLEIPLSPHLSPSGMERYGALLRSGRVNAAARAMLYDDSLGEAISVMHNPIGRVRPDLSTDRRICTVESTGMPANISASRMAAVLTDFEFSHVLIEDYFRKHGCDLEPMYEDQTLWSILGPLSQETYTHLQDVSDHECTDMVLTTATGARMTLAEFYEMKRRYMHRALAPISDVTPRDIDDVYVSLQRILAPLSGQSAQTVEQYISDPKLKSTGNWGRILRNAFIEAGGVPGTHNPDAVLKVVNQMHDAMSQRYI